VFNNEHVEALTDGSGFLVKSQRRSRIMDEEPEIEDERDMIIKVSSHTHG
jgi:hypothetical protein